MLKRYKFDTQKFKLGMRTLKSGLAVFLVILLFHLLKWDGIQIAALSAVFSLREDFGKSVHFGSSRVLSNSIGGFYALLYFILSDLFSHNFWVTLIFIPIFTMLTIMTNVSFNNAPGVISGVATMLIIAPAGDSIFYALQRVFETFVGVFVSVIVNYDIDKIKKRFLS
ncbi:aromatic acid exporter family protein [Streptococcus suis]|nr:aromatic acid exporter family protein [Streptococcus suis]